MGSEKARAAPRSGRGEEGVERVRELTGGEGTTAVLEAVGHLPALEQALGVVRDGGRISRVGVPQYDQVPSTRTYFLRNVTLTGGIAPARAYIDRLLPGWREEEGHPFTTEVTDDQFLLLGPAGSIRLVPEPAMALADWDALLRENGLRVVSGPNAVGAYTIAASSGMAGRDALLQRLRAHRGVRLAEPVAGTP